MTTAVTTAVTLKTRETTVQLDKGTRITKALEMGFGGKLVDANDDAHAWRISCFSWGSYAGREM